MLRIKSYLKSNTYEYAFSAHFIFVVTHTLPEIECDWHTIHLAHRANARSTGITEFDARSPDGMKWNPGQ